MIFRLKAEATHLRATAGKLSNCVASAFRRKITAIAGRGGAAETSFSYVR
jgi:hypothetical protein